MNEITRLTLSINKVTTIFAMFEPFSKTIRDSVDQDGSYSGPLFSRAEIDMLFDTDPGSTINYNMPTLMAESAIYRSTGIMVDMSVQGSAASHLVKAGSGYHQAHNTVQIEKSSSSLRVFDAKDPDANLVPTLTGEDPNRAVSSLDWPNGRVSASKLDLIAIDSRENPAERAFMDQLVVLQACAMHGFIVDDLVGVVEAIWGINFVQMILDNVALAPVSDLASYTATGGRPSPAIYVAASLTSQYRISQRPYVDVAQIGHISGFFARSAALGKFVSMFTTLVNGPYSKVFTFNTNPSHLNAHNSATFSAVVLRSDTAACLSPFAKMIVGMESYAEFIGVRNSLKSATQVEAQASKAAFHRLEDAIKVPRNIQFKDMAGDIYDPLTHEPTVLGHKSSDVSTVRVYSILFTFAHGKPLVEEYCLVNEAIAMCNSLVLSYVSKLQMHPMYSKLYAVPGMQFLLNSVNMIDVKNNFKEVSDALKNEPDQKKIVLLYLLIRFAEIAYPGHDTAHDFAMKYMSGAEVPTALKKNRYGTKRKTLYGEYKICGYFRYTKFMCDYMQHISESRPYTYFNKFRSEFNASSFATSIFDTSISDVINNIDWFNEWYSAFREKNKESARSGKKGSRSKQENDQKRRVDIMNVSKQKTLFKNVRVSWASLYDSKVSAHVSAARLCVQMNSSLRAKLSSLNDTETLTKQEANLLGHMLEALHNTGISMAYRFYSIRLSDDIEMEDSVLDWYANKLLERHKMSVEIVDHTDRLTSRNKSMVKKYLGESVTKMISSFKHVDATEESVEAIISNSYLNARRLVERSVKEMIDKDASYMTPKFECALEAGGVIHSASEPAIFDTDFSSAFETELPDEPKLPPVKADFLGHCQLLLNFAENCPCMILIKYIASNLKDKHEAVNVKANYYRTMKKDLRFMEQAQDFNMAFSAEFVKAAGEMAKVLGYSDDNTDIMT